MCSAAQYCRDDSAIGTSPRICSMRDHCRSDRSILRVSADVSCSCRVSRSPSFRSISHGRCRCHDGRRLACPDRGDPAAAGSGGEPGRRAQHEDLAGTRAIEPAARDGSSDVKAGRAGAGRPKQCRPPAACRCGHCVSAGFSCPACQAETGNQAHQLWEQHLLRRVRLGTSGVLVAAKRIVATTPTPRTVPALLRRPLWVLIHLH